MDPKGAQAVLDVFSQSSPAVAKANIDLSKTYTNKFVDRRASRRSSRPIGADVCRPQADACYATLRHEAALSHPPRSRLVERCARRTMNLLSIQSHVAYGHVGNSAAVFPLQRLGVEVWPIHTVQFSNHTGYGEWQGRVFDAGLIRELVAGIERARRARRMRRRAVGLYRRGRYRRGHPRRGGDRQARQSGGAILLRSGDRRRRPRRIRARGHCRIHARARRCRPPTSSRPIISSSIISPAARAATLAQARDAVKALHELGPRAILVTSLHTDETPDDADRSAGLATRRGCFRLRTPRLDVAANGAGDAIAAMFFAHYLRSRQDRRGAVARRLGDVRRAGEDRGGGRARNPARRGAGRDRQSEPRVRGASG